MYISLLKRGSELGHLGQDSVILVSPTCMLMASVLDSVMFLFLTAGAGQISFHSALVPLDKA